MKRRQLFPTVRSKAGYYALVAGTALISGWSTLTADELDALPSAPTVLPTPLPTPLATQTQPVANSQGDEVIIKSVIPSYVDQGVMMVPMRPLCDFLGVKNTYHDSIITLVAEKPRLITVTLRAGGETAQIQSGGETKTMRLPLRAEERLGTTFLPLRFLADAFEAEIVRNKTNSIVVKSGTRTGVLQTEFGSIYSGGDAARITIVNNVGRALSIRLTGPQNLNVELGRKQSFTRSLRPGVYYYRAASTGMKTVKGSRRLLAGRKAIWAWGRR